MVLCHPSKRRTWCHAIALAHQAIPEVALLLRVLTASSPDPWKEYPETCTHAPEIWGLYRREVFCLDCFWKTQF